MVPPRAARYHVRDLDRLDDEALRAFLRPADGGIDPGVLGRALRGEPELAERIAAVLPEAARERLRAGLVEDRDPEQAERAGRHVVARLFWPLLYWLEPGLFEELTEGEILPAELLDALPISGDVADLGAGFGRFTLTVAARCRSVAAVDVVPGLLRRLEERARQAGLGNVTVHRGGFDHLPLESRSVDAAVFCSALTDRAPHGGRRALEEAERIVRPGGHVVAVWPESPDWLLGCGFSLVSVAAGRSVRFRSVEDAARLCADFYGEDAERWVRENGTATVPFSALGKPEANVACVRRVP